MSSSPVASTPSSTGTKESVPVFSTSASRTSRRRIALLIIAATLISLSPLFTANFTNWDDERFIAKNPWFNPPTWSLLAQFWREPFAGLYVPVTDTVWAVLAVVSHIGQGDATDVSPNPWIFHGFNVLAHVATALIAFQILLLLIEKPWAAGAGALLFALHPIQVESVGWASGLKDVLSGMFALLALWQYLLYAREAARQSGSPQRWRLAVATLAFVLAMLCKPGAMMLPLIAGWIDWWIVRRPLHRIVDVIGPWLVLSLACAIVARRAQMYEMNVAIPMFIRPWLAADTLAFYLYKIVWPLNLCVTYDRAAATMIGRTQIFVTWIVPLTIALTLWIGRKQLRPYIAAAGMFVLGLAPVLNFAPYAFQGYSINADHYTYLSMFGIAMALAFVLNAVPAQRAIAVVMAVVLVTLGALSFRQSLTWHDTFTLFSHTLDINPRSTAAFDNLTAALIESRRLSAARRACYESLKLSPNNPVAWANRGLINKLTGNRDEAVRTFLAAIALNPNDANSMTSLAALFAAERQYDGAIYWFQRALRIDPNQAKARNGLEEARRALRATE